MAAFNFGWLTDSGDSTCLFPIDQPTRMWLGYIQPAVTWAQLILLAIMNYAFAKVYSSFVSQNAQQQASLAIPATNSNARVGSVRPVPLTRMPYEIAQGSNWGEYKAPNLFTEFHLSPFLRTAIALFPFSFNALLQTSLQFFDCMDVYQGSVVRAFPAVSCQSQEYMRLTPLFITMLVLTVVLIPALLTLVLVRQAYFLHGFANGNGLRVAHFRAVWGVLYEPFRLSWCFWGLVLLIRRAVLVSLSVFLPERNVYATDHLNARFSLVVF